MNLKLLDNPGWHALNSHHRHLAIRSNLAARYPADVSIGAAVRENSPAGFDDLRNIVEIGETIGMLGSPPEDTTDWQVLEIDCIPQMVCEALVPVPRLDVVELTFDDVPDMLALIALAQPGPFLPRTIEMGRYLGLRKVGKLIAMAGERLHMIGFCEISAVCTHPDYRGRGYGGTLTTMVAEGIIARGEIPFLHLAATNDVARGLYTKLGFRLRVEIQLAYLKRLA